MSGKEKNHEITRNSFFFSHTSPLRVYEPSSARCLFNVIVSYVPQDKELCYITTVYMVGVRSVTYFFALPNRALTLILRIFSYDLFTALSVDRNMWHQTRGQFVNNELEGILKWSWPNLRLCFGILLRDLTTFTKSLASLGRELSLGYLD
jgi:hypothetical protein